MTIEIAALAVAVLSLALAGWLVLQVGKLRRKLSAIPEDGDVVRILRDLDADLAAAETTLADMAPRLAAVESRLPSAISHIGVVNYDAFGDITGNQSRSIAIMDARGNGIVISLLVGRNHTRFFTKQVRDHRGTEELSPEESAAVTRALST